MRTSFKDPYAHSIKIMRSQLAELPSEVRERLRNDFQSSQEMQLLQQQTYQCEMIGRLEKILRGETENADGKPKAVGRLLIPLCNLILVCTV